MRSAGLCIGGPRDGQMIECEYPQMVVHIGRLRALERPAPENFFSGSRAMHVESFHYAFVPFFNHGFWIPANETPDPQRLIDALVAGYRPKPVVAE